MQFSNELAVHHADVRHRYREIIPLLYSENIFNFHRSSETGFGSTSEVLLAFTRSMPAARLECIRHIRVRFNFDFRQILKRKTYVLRGNGEYRWKQLCQRLKTMTGLVTLHLEVSRATYQTRTRTWIRREATEGQSPEHRLMRQLIGVQARNQTVVKIPWGQGVVGELPGAKFELHEGEGAIEDVVEDGR
jgi:hypothetical protein